MPGRCMEGTWADGHMFIELILWLEVDGLFRVRLAKLEPSLLKTISIGVYSNLTTARPGIRVMGILSQLAHVAMA